MGLLVLSSNINGDEGIASSKIKEFAYTVAMKKILMLIWSLLTFMLLSGSISWAQRVQVFEDWEVWNEGGCYTATKGTNGDFLY